MIPRTLQSYVERDGSYYPVVTGTGPLQSGKTTLVREAFPGYEYVSLEEIGIRSYARDDPQGAGLQRYAGDKSYTRNGIYVRPWFSIQ